jgi:RNA polymerase sigma factor (sigma-70 family)
MVASVAESTVEEGLSAALRIARIRTRAALRARSIPSADRDDLVQELLIACWRAAAAFDPGRGSLRTFLECVIVRRVASAVRTARRKPVILPLDSVSGHGVGPEATEFNVRSDVACVLRQLDREDRRAAMALMEHSPTEAARELRISRSAVYQRIGRLRCRFIAAGIIPGWVDRDRC